MGDAGEKLALAGDRFGACGPLRGAGDEPRKHLAIAGCLARAESFRQAAQEDGGDCYAVGKAKFESMYEPIG